ncbi:hypothetical protein Lser_V15G11021 [Lactuca serriola]
MAGAAAARLFIRSTSARNAAASRFSSGAKTSPFRIQTTKPLSHRIFSCPAELSVCLETVQPFHGVTASALMTSMLTLSRRTCGWIPEEVHKKIAKKCEPEYQIDAIYASGIRNH